MAKGIYVGVGKKIASLPVGSLVKDTSSAYLGKPVIWKVADVNHEGYPNNSVTLITERSIAMRAFDAKEPNNSDSNRKNNGNNRYSVSNIRQWLNSEAGAGMWYSAQHSADQSPSGKEYVSYNAYSNDVGFLNGFSESFKKALLETTLIVGLNTVTDGGGSETVTDKMFLASNTEIGLANENDIAEGTLLSVFNDDTSRIAYVTAEGIADSDSSSNPVNDTKAHSWWLRTPKVQYSWTACLAGSSGTSSSTYVYSGNPGVRPLCNLPSSIEVSSVPDEDGCYTLLWGVDGIAHKVKKAYVGVDSKARKIKKGYIGVGGIARLFYSGDPELSYYGEVDTAASEQYNSSYGAATTVGDYALFAGGSYTSITNQVNAYNSSLIKSTPSTLSVARKGLASTTLGSYALFAGGGDGSKAYYSAIDVYTNTLSKVTANNLSTVTGYPAATTVGNYALFGGGYNGSYVSTMNTYNSSLVKGSTSALSVARYYLAATTVGNYALFAGGAGGSNGNKTNTVDTYNSSLVKGTATALSVARYKLTATTVGDYALFAGGYVGGDEYAGAAVDTYNSSLVKGTATTLSHGKINPAATTLGNFALFGSGSYQSGTSISYSKKVDFYTSNLVKGETSDLPIGLVDGVGTSVGNYALFGIVRKTIYGYQLVD